MKKMIVLMLGLVASTASFATTTEPATSAVAQTQVVMTQVVMTSGHKIKLFVQPLQAKGQLAIRAANGQVVYTETVNLQKGLNQQFDFSGLGTGTYRFTLVAGAETLTKTFVVQADPNASFVVQ